MSTTVEKLAAVIEAVGDKTEKRELQWELLDNEHQGPIQARISSNTVKLEVIAYKSGSGISRDMKFSIFNSSGAQTDTIRDPQLSEVYVPGDHFNWYNYMKEIYDSAKRQIIGADDVLDQISKDLGI